MLQNAPASSPSVSFLPRIWYCPLPLFLSPSCAHFGGAEAGARSFPAPSTPAVLSYLLLLPRVALLTLGCFCCLSGRDSVAPHGAAAWRGVGDRAALRQRSFIFTLASSWAGRTRRCWSPTGEPLLGAAFRVFACLLPCSRESGVAADSASRPRPRTALNYCTVLIGGTTPTRSKSRSRSSATASGSSASPRLHPRAVAPANSERRTRSPLSRLGLSRTFLASPMATWLTDVIFAVTRRDPGPHGGSLPEPGSIRDTQPVRPPWTLSLTPRSSVELEERTSLPLLSFSTTPPSRLQLMATRAARRVLGRHVLVLVWSAAGAHIDRPSKVTPPAVPGALSQTRCGG